MTLIIGLVPVMVIGLYTLNTATNSLKASAVNHLKSVNALKKNQIEALVSQRYRPKTHLTA